MLLTRYNKVSIAYSSLLGVGLALSYLTNNPFETWGVSPSVLTAISLSGIVSAVYNAHFLLHQQPVREPINYYTIPPANNQQREGYINHV